MKKSSSIFKTLMTLLALALPLSCDSGGGGSGGVETHIQIMARQK